MEFSQFTLDNRLVKATESLGFKEATPIQEQTIPLVLEGRDVMGQAQTGTGKTAAFGLPVLHRIDEKKRHTQALIITPTRELAIQVSGQLQKLGNKKGVRVVSIYGGVAISKQISQLKQGAHIVVATPGRLIDHLQRGTLRVETVKMVVLDEADEMLQMGFVEDIETVLKRVPKTRQVLLFSATMAPAIEKIGKTYMNKPAIIKVASATLSAQTVEQYFTKAEDKEKFDILVNFLTSQQPTAALIFARTKKRVDELINGLKQCGFNAEGIHSDLAQQKRLRILEKFKKGHIKLLVGTDVAARGLDVNHISHVFNFDMPQDTESYVHRIGRTGRAGQSGVAITFVQPRETGYLRMIETDTNQSLKPLKPIDRDEMALAQLNKAAHKIMKRVEREKLGPYYEQAERLLEEHAPERLVALLLKMEAKPPRQVGHVSLSPQRPLPYKADRPAKRKNKKRSRRRR